MSATAAPAQNGAPARLVRVGLGAAGIALFLTGVFLAGPGLYVPGAALIGATILYSRLGDLDLGSVTLGLPGLGVTLQRRDAEFEPFFEQEKQHLFRLALLLAGDADVAHDLSTQALASTRVRWRQLRPDERSAFPVRELVALVENAPLRLRLTTGRDAAAETLRGPWAETAGALRALPPAARAAAVLHLDRGLDEDAIAAILRRPSGAVRLDVEQARELLRPILSAEGPA